MADVQVQEAQANNHPTRKPFKNVLRWFFFSVVIGSSPIIFSFIYAHATKGTFSLPETLSHGPLLVVSIVLAGEAFRDLRTRRRVADPEAMVDSSSLVFYGSIIVFLGTCFMFAIVAAPDAMNAVLVKSVIDASNKNLGEAVMALKNTHNSLDAGFIMWYSFIFFAIALVAGGCSKWTEE